MSTAVDNCGQDSARHKAAQIKYMGMRFHDVTMSEALSHIDQFVRSRKPHKVFTPNVAAFIQARKNRFLWSFYEDCDLLTLDGMGIYYAAPLAGLRFRETVPGSYLMFELLAVAGTRGYRVFLLGTRPELLERAVANLRRQYPRLNLVGFADGYFTPEDEPRVVEKIKKARADLLFIGMPTPQKEAFVARNFHTLGVPAQLGVGGTLDVLAGVFRLPPPWVRRAGCEWLYRLIQEPRRLWKRYLTTNLVFGCLVLKQVASRFCCNRTKRGRNG